MWDDHHFLLPQDVLVQILVLLPIVSLLRFKSVSKSWRALIESSFFIDLHANTLNYYSSKFGSFIFQTSGYTILDTMTNGAFMLYGCGGDSEIGEFKDLKFEDLEFPLCYKVLHNRKIGHDSYRPANHETWMVGSCNGLICIQDTKQRDVSLWNPATRQFRFLPKPLTFVGHGDLVEDFVAFGYDAKTKDYKVVLISYFKPYMSDHLLPLDKHIFRIQLYKSSTDSWMLLDDIDYFRARPGQGLGWCSHGVYLNGSYYFVGSYDVPFEDPLLLSFDFSKEVFNNIQVPPMEFPTWNYNLSYFNEKLALFTRIDTIYTRDEGLIDNYDIWVLNEHETKEPWTKLHSFTVTFYETPRGISNSGEYALIEFRDRRLINGDYEVFYKLRLLNLVTKEVEKEFLIDNKVIRAYAYKQSLVSISGNGTPTTHDRFNDGVM